MSTGDYFEFLFGGFFVVVILGVLFYTFIIRPALRRYSKWAGRALNVSIGKTEVRAGDQLEVHVQFTSKKDLHVRHGKVRLVRVETYVDEYQTRHGRRRRKCTSRKSIEEKTFIQDENIHAMDSVDTKVALPVPSDAIPTLKGATTRLNFSSFQPGISWEIETKLDIPKAIDMSTTQDIVILKPLESADTPSSSVTAETEKEKYVLTLSLSHNNVSSNSKIGGVFTVETLKDIKVSEARVELIRVEEFGDATKSTTVDKAILEQDINLPEGWRRAWPFQLNVGQVDMPSFKIGHSSVRWTVVARLDMKLRLDPKIRQEIKVNC